jgi:hypothetical protein
MTIGESNHLRFALCDLCWVGLEHVGKHCLHLEGGRGVVDLHCERRVVARSVW